MIVTLVLVPTLTVVTGNVLLVAPAATVTLAGTVATAVLLLDSDTTAPPLGAAAVSVTVPVEDVPPTTLVGLTETDDSVGVVDACGWKRRVAENGPNTPAEFLARTRHQSRCAGSPPIDVCDAVTVALATNGAAMVDESSIWIS